MRSAALPIVLLLALTAGACASSRAFSRAERAARGGDWDTAVAYYTRAVQSSPDKPEYKVGLQRALEMAAVSHLEKGRVFEAKNQLEEALREYRRAAEYNPLSGELTTRVQAVETKLREQLEAQRPKPRLDQLREQARQSSAEPVLNPASRTPLDIVFNNAPLSQILRFIGQWTGINITFERDAAQPAERQQYTIELHGVTLEQALYQILMANGFYYKVLDPHTIMVIQDQPTKRMLYEEQAIQTFYVSHADANDVMTVIAAIVRLPGATNPPTMQVNKTSNTITVRATPGQLKVLEQVIRANDKPRAELLIDVEVLEVNRTRAAQYGLDLNDYSANLVFSPEVVPGTNTSTSGGTDTTASATGITHTNLFNINSLRGITRGDFYLSVPAAIIRMLESDSDTRLVAKPQLRGSEGEKLTLNLGSQIPVPNTTFGAAAAGGINTIPISSFTLKDVGLNFEITPRVTFEGDIILTLALENSTFAGNINTAGQNLPSFGQRKVSTRLRLRDGEPNLLAGLLQTNESKSTSGLPGLVRLPVFKQLFSSNNSQSTQTDIVMLLTPHVIRSHDLTQSDVSPIYIGTSSNMGISGPPPLIAAPPEQPPAAGAAGGQPPTGGAVAGQPPVPPAIGGAPGAVRPTTPPAPPPATPPGTPPATAGQPPVAPPGAQPGAPAQPPAPAAATPPAGAPVVAVTATAPDFRVGGGPYTVPIMISGASGVSTMTVTLRYNSTVLRVRSVQEGNFMRQGGVNAQFGQQVDATTGRIDMTFTRAGDTTGASGGGLLSAVIFETVAAGSATLTVSGAATGPTGTPIPLQFTPATVTVK